MKIILGKNYFSYKEALSKLRLEKLDCRREKICLNFAKKSFKNEKVKHFFDKDHKLHKMNTRSKNIFKIRAARTKRFQQSAIPYMVNLLNNELRDKRKMIVSQKNI